MAEDIMRIIGKVIGVVGGLGLIALVLIWFGAIPLVATIFEAVFTGWQLIALLAMMIAVIALIVKYVMK